VDCPLPNSDALMPIATLLEVFAASRQDVHPSTSDLRDGGRPRPVGDKFSTGTSKVLAISMIATSAHAHEINDQLSTGGVLAGAVQCQKVSGAPDSSNTCKSVFPFQTELSLRPTETEG